MATHLLLPLMALSLALSWWLAVHYAPGVLSRLLPATLTFWAGAAIFILGGFTAVAAVYFARDPQLFLAALVQCFAGTWFMLAPTAALRGDPEDARLMARLAVMLASALAVLLVSLYVRAAWGTATLQLWLVLFGAAVALRPRLWSR